MGCSDRCKDVLFYNALVWIFPRHFWNSLKIFLKSSRGEHPILAIHLGGSLIFCAKFPSHLDKSVSWITTNLYGFGQDVEKRTTWFLFGFIPRFLQVHLKLLRFSCAKHLQSTYKILSNVTVCIFYLISMHNMFSRVVWPKSMIVLSTINRKMHNFLFFVLLHTNKKKKMLLLVFCFS